MTQMNQPWHDCFDFSKKAKLPYFGLSGQKTAEAAEQIIPVTLTFSYTHDFGMVGSIEI